MNAAPDQMPSRWEAIPVSEIFKIVGGGTPSTEISEYWNGTIPWITSADIDERHQITPRRSVSDKGIAESATNRVPAGSLIVVTRVGLGKVAIAPTELCFSQDSQALLFKPELIEPRYALFYLSQAVAIFRHVSRGTTISGVTKKQLANLLFLLAPRAEQDRIVAEIEKQFTRLDAAVAALKRVQANLKRYRAAVLKAACEGRLVPTEAELARKEGRSYETGEQLLARMLKERRTKWEAHQLARMIAAGKPPKDDSWKKRYKEPDPPDTSNVPSLPEGWVWASLDQLFAVERGRFSIRPRNDPRYYGGDYPFVQIGDLPREGGSIREFNQTLNDEGLRVSKMFSRGAVLIAIVGATIANTGVLAFDSCCPDSVVGLQSDDLILLRFVEFYLRLTKLSLRTAAYSSGGQPNINLGLLLPLPVPLAPADELSRLVAEIDSRIYVLDALNETVAIQSTRADRLRQSILKHAFEGKVVPQDPNDEPASALLERIRAERETALTGTEPTRRRRTRKAAAAEVTT